MHPYVTQNRKVNTRSINKSREETVELFKTEKKISQLDKCSITWRAMVTKVCV